MRSRLAAFVSLLFIAVGLAVAGAAAPASASGPGYYYAGAFQSGVSSANGIGAKIWVANPYLQCNTSEHSLMEITARDTVANNTMEFGWIKDGCGGVPKLFASYWKAGVWSGCYFACTGWNDNGSNPINLGADLSTVAASCNGTTTLTCVKQFTFQYIASACGTSSAGVFFYYDNVNVGCMQSSLIPGTTTFSEYQAFSEVYYGGSTVPCSDGGNGKYPTSVASAAGAAFFGSISYVGTAPPTAFMSLNTDTDTPAYTAVAVGTAGRTFTVGGYGRNSSGGTPGNTGSC
jgi:hypothetical protein